MIKLQPLGGQTAFGEGDKSKINAQAARGQMRRQFSVFSKSQTVYLKTENLKLFLTTLRLGDVDAQDAVAACDAVNDLHALRDATEDRVAAVEVRLR